MANNKAIQILRTDKITDNNESVVLLDGQPFYNKQKNYLTIGNGPTKTANGLPITVPTVEGWFDDIDQPNDTQTEKYLANVGGNATDANKYYIRPSRHYSNEQSIVDMLEMHAPDILLDTNDSNLIRISSENGISLIADGESQEDDYRLILKSPLIQLESGGNDDYLEVAIGKNSDEEYAMQINCVTTIKGRTEIEGYTSIKGSTLIAGSSIDLKSNIGEPSASISLKQDDGQIIIDSQETSITTTNEMEIKASTISIIDGKDKEVLSTSDDSVTVAGSLSVVNGGQQANRINLNLSESTADIDRPIWMGAAFSPQANGEYTLYPSQPAYSKTSDFTYNPGTTLLTVKKASITNDTSASPDGGAFTVTGGAKIDKGLYLTGTQNPGGSTVLGNPTIAGLPLVVGVSGTTSRLVIGPRDVYCKTDQNQARSFALNDLRQTTASGSNGIGQASIGGTIFVNMGAHDSTSGEASVYADSVGIGCRAMLGSTLAVNGKISLNNSTPGDVGSPTTGASLLYDSTSGALKFIFE